MTTDSASTSLPPLGGGACLSSPPTVLQLVNRLEPVHTHARCDDVLGRFLANHAIYALPVVDTGRRPVALLDRKHYIEFFSKPFSREIFGKDAVADLLNHDHYATRQPIVVEQSCGVDDVARIVISAGAEHMATGFIVCHEGRYLGVANGHDLLNVITRRKQDELYHLANYDHLTGIPNRMLLGDRLEQACRDAERTGRYVGLLFIDVDRFKQINDALGHRVGDRVLCKVVERLRLSARRNDTVARLGGDEFVILMEDLEDVGGADPVALRVLEAMRIPVDVPGHSLSVTVSIGSAMFPIDSREPSPLLAKADAAMYEAKSGGRNGFRRYSSDTATYNPTSISLENDLRRGIERDELRLVYQPQVSLDRELLRGVEALVRWEHPVLGLVPPAQFIPLAEESGLIIPLGEWVIREALSQMHRWTASGLPSMRVSINVSALQLRRGDLPRFLHEQIRAHGVDPRQIELELTESVVMYDLDGTLNMLQEIKRLGIKLAIDDFGTGFSSLSYLRRFPIDRLKIDQSFVRNIATTPANESIARAIVALAESLALDTVAEGIETQAERAVLAALGCAEGQGYLFAHPLPAAELVAWIGKHRGRRDIADLFEADFGPGLGAQLQG